MRLFLLFISGVFTLVITSCNSIDINSVNTKYGRISGKENQDKSVKIFLGIPFAAPPIGDLRWKAPQPPKPWEETRKCITLPPSAMQPIPEPFFCWTKEFLAPKEPISEDCLYLNIWTPAHKSTDKLPVMVWIHGGGFSGGSGTVPLYNGEAMAKKGVVFITVNYRLGIFGFLAHPELSAETENHVSGNYALLDQIAALKWVQSNIAAFGGDPRNVTIAGQSAGAFSVNLLVASPVTKGLFHKAIAQSGGMFDKNPNKLKSLKDAENIGSQITQQMNLSLKQLRSLNADSLLKIQSRFGPVVDNVVISPVYETFTAKKHNAVPLLTGWNADDGVSFDPPLNMKDFKENIRKQYGVMSDSFLVVFPANNNEEAVKNQKVLSQLRFGWQNYTWACMQNNRTYLYYFKRVPPGEPNYGAFHSAEFGYALHTLKFWDRPFTEIDYRLEDIMSSYWVNFAKTGNPNGEGLPKWPLFSEENPQVMELGDSIKAGPLPWKEQLYFLDKMNQ